MEVDMMSDTLNSLKIILPARFAIEQLERFSHFTQRRFGLTNFAWARVCAVVVMVLSSIFLFWGFQDVPKHQVEVVGLIMQKFLAVSLLIASAGGICVMPWLEQVGFERVARGKQNPLKEETFLNFGIVVMACSLLGLVVALFSMDIWTVWAFAYPTFSLGILFLACDPLPPSPENDLVLT